MKRTLLKDQGKRLHDRYASSPRRARKQAGGVVLAALLAAWSACAGAAEPFVPNFWDPQRRVEKPDTSALRGIRFVTEDDFPPFNFLLPEGTLAGFNVDLARALCEELKLPCTIQPRRWDTLTAAVKENAADAIIASIAITPQTQADLDFTAPYYRTPARFVAVKAVTLPEISPDALANKTIAVEARTAHEAFLKSLFPRASLKTYENAAAARAGLKRGEADVLFGDGIALAVWLSGADGSACCGFVGGPYLESRFFGDGVGIAVRKDNALLRRALDWALRRVAERGTYGELYLKYFPVGFF